MLVAGIVIGSGIFMQTGKIAAATPSVPLILLAWIVGGAISTAGALCYAELGGMMPHSGAQYVFLREAFHPLYGFLYGWAGFLIIHSASIAAVGVGFATYFGTFVPAVGPANALLAVDCGALGTWRLNAGQVTAVALIALLTWLNVLGVKVGGRVQTAFGLAKIGGAAGLAVAGFLIGRTASPSLATTAPVDPATGGLLAGFGAALIRVFWAYDGWNDTTFAAGEIKNPQRNLPRALLLGMGIVTAFYVGMNVFYVYAVPIPEMTRIDPGDGTPGIQRIAHLAAERSLGPTAVGLVSAAVALSTFGCVNGIILTGGRLYWAMAREGLFFRGIAATHGRFRTPHVALVWQGVVSALLAISGSYDQLTTYVIFAALVFYALTVAGVIVLRRRNPDWPRPYRVPLYPWLPILYVAASAVIVANTLLSRPAESLIGLGIILAGVPLYFLWRRRGASVETPG
jgi:APA family basic amino acid/polyamine antiporter